MVFSDKSQYLILRYDILFMMVMNRLKELRNEKKLFQKDFANSIGMSQSGYSQYETETTDMPTAMLKKFSNIFNVSIDYLLCLTNKKEVYQKSQLYDVNSSVNRLKEIREDRDLNQTEIAKILNMSQNGYSQYETNTIDISTKVLKKLAEYYNVSIDYLLYMTDERKRHK